MKVFYKNRVTDRIWWVDRMGMSGQGEISFDRKKVYNLFRDYPHNMTEDEVLLFDRENPLWADYLRDRSVKVLAGPRIVQKENQCGDPVFTRLGLSA